MAKAAWTCNGNIAGTTQFRIWGKAISDALTALGMIKTADTGQIDWATVIKPLPNTIAGYEVWRFNDSLQSTVPIFFNLSYGTANSGNHPRLVITIGSNSDGAGVITGLPASFTIVSNGSSTPEDNSSRLSFMASDGSGISFIHQADNTLASIRSVFVIDRFRNIDGSPNNNGYIIMLQIGGQSFMTTYYQDKKTISLYNGSISRGMALMPIDLTAGMSLSISGTVYFMPYNFIVPGGSGIQRVKMILCYAASDFGFNSDQMITHLGASRKYKTLGTNFGYCDSRSQQYATAALWQED